MHVSISLFSSAKDNRAVRTTIPWAEFLTDLREPTVEQLDPSPENVTVIKMRAPAFSPALFKEDRRKKSNVETAQVLTYDIDEDIDAHDLSNRLRRRGVSFAIHHTTSAGFSVAETGRGSVHVLIPLARPVEHEQYLRYWDEARAWFHGIEVDTSKRGAESLFFAPRIFEAHKNGYFFDAVTDAPFLGSSGFAPFRPDLKGVDKYVAEVANARQKHVTVNRIAFTLGLVGVPLEEAKTRLIEALKANTVSEPVGDWYAAETTIVSAWTDGAAQKDANDSRPKFVPEAAKATGRKVLREACAGIRKGENLAAWSFRVGQFVPHVLELEVALESLQDAWQGAKNHDTRSLSDAVQELLAGLDAGKLKPVGVHEEWQRDLKMTADGLGFHAGENNVHLCLERHPDLLGLVVHDVREGAPVYLREPPWHEGRRYTYPRWLKDPDKQRLAVWIRDELGVVNVTPRTALDALIDHANGSQYDGLVQYFDGLGTVEGTEELETILVRTLGAEDTPYVRAVTKKWLVGLVARQYEPGCKVDNMLVLVGDQGLGKSTWLEELFPKELQEQCFDDTLSLHRFGKDEVIKLSQLALVEIGELASMSKADIESVKALVSSKKGNERAAFMRLVEKYKRRAVFAGTTNHDDFLKDPTGNRRFWPVVCTEKLDRDLLHALRDIMWAQAVSAYKRGESWHLGAEEETLAVEVRVEHEEEDSWEHDIRTLLACWPAPGKFDDPKNAMLPWQLDEHRKVRFVRLAQLADRMGLELSDRGRERRLAACLKKLGLRSGTIKQDGATYRMWSVQPVRRVRTRR